MNLTLLIRISRVIALSIALGLLALFGLAACANGTPQVKITLPDTPTPAPTQPASLPTAVSLVSPTPSPDLTPLITPTPVISFNLNDLSGGPIFGGWGLTTTIYLDVSNRAPITGPETIMYVYDGDPQAGGELIAQERFPKVPPKANGRNGIVTKEVVWDVRGRAGEYKIFVYLCLADVQPSSATCGTWGGGIHSPADMGYLYLEWENRVGVWTHQSDGSF